MSNSKFVEVVANSSTSHGPNWTYTTAPPSQAHTNPLRGTGAALGARHQRAAKNLGYETSAAREGKIVRHLLELEKDNYRDVQIPVTTKKSNMPIGRAVKGKKPTPNVRRILASNKTFQNYLADEEALHGSAPAATSNSNQALRSRRASTYSRADSDEEMEDADGGEGAKDSAAPSPADLKGVQKNGGPPLGYNNAKVEPSIKPRRHFCEICGYWGNYKCQKCGVRYCSMECGSTHSETRCMKFYA